MIAKNMSVYGNIKSSSLNVQLASQCAPVIFGVKVSNILITRPENEMEVYRLFDGTDLAAKCIQKTETKAFFLLYHKQRLHQHLMQKSVLAFLKETGYEDLHTNELLNHFSQRFKTYNSKQEFPHEIGIFLGYPIEDVIAFIEHKGKNYLLSGYWKVYGNPETAKRTFRIYDQVKQLAVSIAARGVPMEQILKINFNKIRRNDISWTKFMWFTGAEQEIQK